METGGSRLTPDTSIKSNSFRFFRSPSRTPDSDFTWVLPKGPSPSQMWKGKCICWTLCTLGYFPHLCKCCYLGRFPRESGESASPHLSSVLPFSSTHVIIQLHLGRAESFPRIGGLLENFWEWQWRFRISDFDSAKKNSLCFSGASHVMVS